VLVVTSCGAAQLLRRALGPAGPRVLAAAGSALALWWIASAHSRTEARPDPVAAGWEQRLAAEVPADAVVGSDLSWIVSWKAGRNSVRFYGDAAQLERIERDYVDVDFVWLSAATSRRFEREASAWRLVHRTADGTSLWADAAGASKAGAAQGPEAADGSGAAVRPGDDP
jgi:hypothetical protein